MHSYGCGETGIDWEDEEMNETGKHTPGPWNTGWTFWEGDEEIAYGINRGKGTISDTEATANARLIAAAPELLESVKELSITLVGRYMAGITGNEEIRRMLASADATIARTEGKD